MKTLRAMRAKVNYLFYLEIGNTLTFSPSFRLAGERVEQRSAFGVSRLFARHSR